MSNINKSPSFTKKGWQGQCAVGVYPGERTFANGVSVRGVFGMGGIEEECHAPVTARCQLSINGRLTPYYWLACDNPEHRRDAGIIEHLDADGRVIRVERVNLLHEAVQDIANAAKTGAAIGGFLAGLLTPHTQHDGDRVCEFCGCHTNAKQRRCCARGQAADRAKPQYKGSKAKKRAAKLLKG
jgi:hypothetical protein